ncbi:tRNA (guanine-N(1)-)-methyltransferase [bacterium BMS3Abin05]|nr:tRNA (guanine-N(1)-)-methyltransferase [bacterium BMS3Abin05]GBE28903.1 tRNA (guanine-N(1)-)-methyltransferase [bacterium BMS3Bbin03]HDK36118.1 tRNA (guanosine(37)-N1)-methyltransferase TrmD [Bacteroidota bacterium]HDZ12697.1 tRNA (guanosine(37)-N1)-methyltransferase TrmD [Bacteroidota bacterium]
MRIDIVTAFPELVRTPLQESILKRAREKGLVQIFIHDLREFTTDKHHQVDDYPYGGGSGMIMKPEPFFRAFDKITREFPSEKRKVIFMSPQGKTFHQKMANELVHWEHLIFLCGHYKGVDERVTEALVTDEISIGDYVLTGGELPALVVIDAVVRLIPDVINDYQSAATDTFQQDLLDHPHYTRPEDYRGYRVPDVLLSGHHQKIEEWRKQKSLERTIRKRKDLLKNLNKNNQ